MLNITPDILRLIAGALKNDKSALVSFMNTSRGHRAALIGIVWPMCHNPDWPESPTLLVSDYAGYIKYNDSILAPSENIVVPVRTIQCVLKEFCPNAPMPPRMLAVTMAVHVTGTIAFTWTDDGAVRLCVHISRELWQFLRALAAIFNNPGNRDTLTSLILGRTITTGGYVQRWIKNMEKVIFAQLGADGTYLAYLDTRAGYTLAGTTIDLVARVNVQYGFIRLIAG